MYKQYPKVNYKGSTTFANATCQIIGPCPAQESKVLHMGGLDVHKTKAFFGKQPLGRDALCVCVCVPACLHVYGDGGVYVGFFVVDIL